MGSVRCHVWSSLSCSSDSTTSSSMSAADDAADRLVKIELEAAEALADLAHLAVRESGGGGSSGEWGCKGKRGTKRVKSESPRSDSALNLNPVDSGPICPDLAEVIWFKLLRTLASSHWAFSFCSGVHFHVCTSVCFLQLKNGAGPKLVNSSNFLF